MTRLDWFIDREWRYTGKPRRTFRAEMSRDTGISTHLKREYQRTKNTAAAAAATATATATAWSQMNHSSQTKWSSVCTRQDLGRKYNILQYVTPRLMFTRFVTMSKMGVVFIKQRSESQCTVLLGYLTISTNVRCYHYVFYNNFVFQPDSVPVHLAFDTVQLLQCKTLNFLYPELWPTNSP